MNLEQLIEDVYTSKYSIWGNNCFHKALRLVKEARKLGHSAKFVVCISHPRHSAFLGLSLYALHFYTVINGEKIDVSFDPETEKLRMSNEDVKMTKGVIVPWV